MVTKGISFCNNVVLSDETMALIESVSAMANGRVANCAIVVRICSFGSALPCIRQRISERMPCSSGLLSKLAKLLAHWRAYPCTISALVAAWSAPV